MKKLLVIIALLVVGFAQPVNSQVSVHVNIGVQPLWGPVGYDYVEYYYLPDYEVYYYVPTGRFVYLDGPKWVFAAALPPRFGTINYYSAYKVVINQPKAYLQFKTHKAKYVTYKGGGGKQIVIRDSREPKYFAVKGHPSHAEVKKVATPAPVKVKSAPVKVKSAPAPKMYKSEPAPSFKSHGDGHGGGGGNKGGGGKKGAGGHGKGGGKH